MKTLLDWREENPREKGQSHAEYDLMAVRAWRRYILEEMALAIEKQNYSQYELNIRIIALIESFDNF